MQSAPAAIPAMTAVSFPAGFAPADATLDVLNTTLSAISSTKRVCSANPITGTKPAHETRRSSSKTGTARDQPSCSFTFGAFCSLIRSGTRHSRFSKHRRHLNVHDPPNLLSDPRIEAKLGTAARCRGPG